MTPDAWSDYYTLDSANEQLKATADLLKTAEDHKQVALGRFKARVGSIVDVLTAQTVLATARQQRIAAELGWEVARAQLALALGRNPGSEPLTDSDLVP